MGQLLKKLSGNDNYLYIFDSKEWKAISKLIDKETYEAEKNLAGYSTKRGDVVSNIMFSKEVIIYSLRTSWLCTTSSSASLQ